MEDKVLKIVVAIDTSLSMTDEIISKIFTEIFSIVSGKKHDITVIECDAEIQKIYKVKRKQDIPKSVSGRGGTAFTPVIKYVNEHKYYKDALLIYFTDGDGESEIPKPLVYRTLWVITDKAGQLSVNNSYGRVVSME
jgi:predicted metal-dependent peptidase